MKLAFILLQWHVFLTFFILLLPFILVQYVVKLNFCMISSENVIVLRNVAFNFNTRYWLRLADPQLLHTQ